MTAILTPDPNGDSLASVRAGLHLYVVSGPVDVNGVDWYLVQWLPTRSYPAILGWIPAEGDGRALVRPIEPPCPRGAVDVPTLVGLIPAERVGCFGDRTIVLRPVIAAEHNPALEVEGSPGWLAVDSRWRLYGADGPEGVEGYLQVFVSPDAGGSLPAGQWLEVSGHFDDAAAATRQRRFVGQDAPNLVPEAPAEQVLRCRENFVITAFRATAGP